MLRQLALDALDGLDLRPYLRDSLGKVVEANPVSRIDELVPWGLESPTTDTARA